VRPRRLLRQLAEPSCNPPQRRDPSSPHPLVRTRWELVVVLSRRAAVRGRPRAAGSFAQL